MVILSKIAKLVLGMDQFGQEINFQMNGNDNFYTYPGSFFSILCNIIVMAYGYYLATDMFTYGNSKLTQNYKHNFFSQKDVY